MAYEYRPKEGKKEGQYNRLLIAIVLVALDVLLYYAELDLPYRILRAVLGLLFVLFIPGWIATYAFFRDGIDYIERIALAIGLSISLVVLTVMFSNLALHIPINFTTIVIEISAICAVFYGLSKIPAPAFNLAMPAGKKLYIIGGIAVIGIIFALDIFYPYFATPAPVQEQKMVLSDLYNTNMTVYSVYPQKGLSATLSGVGIPETSLIVFDRKVALLSSTVDNIDVAPGESFHVAYYWMKLNESDKEYSVKLDITDMAGTSVFSETHKFAAPLKNGAVLMEEYDVRVPKLSEGTYLLRVGIPGASVTSGSFIDNQNRAIIGTIKVRNASISLSDLYNSSMKVMIFYPQKKVSLNSTGVTIQNPVVVNFDNSIALLGYAMDKTRLKPNETFHITYYWKSLEPVDVNYTAFVHFTNDNGAIKFQQDHALPIKTSLWNKGDIIAEEYDVKVPSINESTYQIRIGLYDQFGNGHRMPIFYGPTDKENRAIIGSFNVTKILG